MMNPMRIPKNAILVYGLCVSITAHRSNCSVIQEYQATKITEIRGNHSSIINRKKDNAFYHVLITSEESSPLSLPSLRRLFICFPHFCPYVRAQVKHEQTKIRTLTIITAIRVVN